MASTTFVDGATVIVASWLNDVNQAVYGTINPNVGTFGSSTQTPVITADSHGNIIAASQVASMITLTGDVTANGTTAGTAATLATVNSNVGTFGSSTQIPVVTVNGKGLVTAVSTATSSGPQYSITTSNFVKTSDTTLANIPGLTATLVSAGVYKFKAVLQCSSASPTIKIAISGTATATSITYGYAGSTTGGVYVDDNTTTFGAPLTNGGFSASGIGHMLTIEGAIVVNAGGTLTVQAAQQSSNVTSLTVLTNSTFTVERIS